MRVVYSGDARKQLKKLDNSVKVRSLLIMKRAKTFIISPCWLQFDIVGNYIGLWRYRVGDYRILCDIKNDELCILVVDVGHRRDVYEYK